MAKLAKKINHPSKTSAPTRRAELDSQEAQKGGKGLALILPEGILPSAPASPPITIEPDRDTRRSSWTGLLHTAAFCGVAARVMTAILMEGLYNGAALIYFLVFRRRFQRRMRGVIVRPAAAAPPAPKQGFLAPNPGRLEQPPGRKDLPTSRSLLERLFLIALPLLLALLILGGAGCKAVEPLSWSVKTLSGADEIDRSGDHLWFSIQVLGDPEFNRPHLLDTFEMIGWY